VAHGADLFVHQWVEQIQWLGENEWAISVLVLAGAGIYQFMPLKYACLGKCRSPLSFIVEHWRGQHPQSEALLLGVRHGLFCVGCCWSLMLLMFAIASGSIVWMLLLGAIMAVEKNVSWGKRIGAPLGVALLLGSTGLVLGALINI
jgi:predicted metal-binding membrane protein